MSFSARPWRVGRKVGRTIYDANDKLIGTMDSAEDAGLVVEAVARLGAKDLEEAETLAPSLQRFESALAAQEEARIRAAAWNEAIEACIEMYLREHLSDFDASTVVPAELRKLKRSTRPEVESRGDERARAEARGDALADAYQRVGALLCDLPDDPSHAKILDLLNSMTRERTP